jgi:fermentation-respiration switch protein FrsA (DUF1100 family)
LGGAAALLAQPPLEVDAIVAESVYPSIDRAIPDRLSVRLGSAGRMFAPLLTAMLRPRLGFGADELRPIDHVRTLKMPKLFIFGTKDRDTTVAESTEVYNRAAEPKEMWAVEGAGHVDLCRYAGREYEVRVLEFLDLHL